MRLDHKKYWLQTPAGIARSHMRMNQIFVIALI